jgi:predicted nuclease of restriction endonuclease-like (RecB) superfamily
MKLSKPRDKRAKASSVLAAPPEEQSFAEVVEMIQEARGQALTAVNTALIDLYWKIGGYISRKLETAAWGEGVVDALARYIQRCHSNLRGFTRPRPVLNPPKVSTLLRQLHPAAETVFRDSYVVEFLDLPDGYREADLRKSLLGNLRHFLTELGRDFCFVGSEVPLQVGGKDFALDLLFFHRGPTCLVAFELKIGEFQPEHLGKLNFYLEALDRDVRKPHEGPSIGVLLCASKDSEVVEYALSRSLSPTLIAEYQTQLPDKKLLQAKLHEFYTLTATETK